LPGFGKLKGLKVS